MYTANGHLRDNACNCVQFKIFLKNHPYGRQQPANEIMLIDYELEYVSYDLCVEISYKISGFSDL